MSDEQTPDASAPSARPQRRQFRKPFNAVRIAPEAAARQGRAATVAWSRFGNRDEAVAFLNAHDEGLGGRPIDIAVESDEGLQRVETLLASVAPKG